MIDAGRLLKNLISLSTGELASRIIGFTAFALLARRLDPGAYGAIEFAVALSLFFAMVVDFGLETIGARSVAQNQDDAARLTSQIPAARLLTSLLAIPIMGGVAIASGQPPTTVSLVWLFSIGLLGVPWFQRWLLQGLELMGWVSLGQVIRSAVFCLGVFIFVQAPSDVLVVGRVEILSATATALFYLAVEHRCIGRIRLDFSLAGIRGLFRDSSFIGLSQIVWAANQYLPTILVAMLSTPAELSWFGAAQRIVFSVVAFSWVYHFNLFPSLSRSLAVSRPAFDGLVRASFRTVSWLAILAGLTGALFADVLIRRVFGEEFGAAALPLAILVWAIPVTLLSGHARWALVAAGEQRLVLVSQVAGVMTSVIVGLVAIPKYGAVGCAATTVASYGAVWIAAHVMAVRRVAPLPLLGVGRPLLVAATVYTLRAMYAPGNLVAGLAAIVGYLVLGPLLDARFVSDLRQLLVIRRRSVDAAA